MALSVGSTVSVAGLVFFGTITSLAAKIGKQFLVSRVLRPGRASDSKKCPALQMGCFPNPVTLAIMSPTCWGDTCD